MGGGGGGTGGGGASFPKNDAQVKHIFRNATGHLSDTVKNRVLITNAANNPKNYLGTDKYGNRWYVQLQPDGSQIWVRVRDGMINNAGINNPPKPWDPKTGLNKNPFKQEDKR